MISCINTHLRSAPHQAGLLAFFMLAPVLAHADRPNDLRANGTYVSAGYSDNGTYGQNTAHVQEVNGQYSAFALASVTDARLHAAVSTPNDPDLPSYCTVLTCSWGTSATATVWETLDAHIVPGSSTREIPWSFSMDGIKKRGLWAWGDGAYADAYYYFGPDPQGWNHPHQLKLGASNEVSGTVLLSEGDAEELYFYASLRVSAYSGSVSDYSNTMAFHWQLPPGVTVTSSSGQFMAAVPEPSSGSLLLAGGSLLGWVVRRRRHLEGHQRSFEMTKGRSLLSHPRVDSTRGRTVMAVTAFAATLALSGCGGGSSAESTPDAQPVSDTTALDVASVAASSASLAWLPSSRAATWSIDRRHAGGDWIEIVQVDARDGAYFDAAVDAGSDYEYRLREGSHVLGQGSLHIGTAQPMLTPRGSVIPGTDVSAVLALPAPSNGEGVQAQTITNTAPTGVGDAVRLQLATRPIVAQSLALRYPSQADSQADALRIAVQRSDGSWLALPLSGLNKTTRTVTALLSPSLFLSGAPSVARTISAGSAVVEISAALFQAYKLQPSEARVSVRDTQELQVFSPLLSTNGGLADCLHIVGLESCLIQPLLPAQPVVTGGATAHWFVADSEGGKAGLGSVAALEVGHARYTAPDSVPAPAQVPVSVVFGSSGKTTTLTAQLTIWDSTSTSGAGNPSWTGFLHATVPASGAGTSLDVDANLSWTLDSSASTGTRQVYRAHGDLTAVIKDDNCSVVISPATHPVTTTPEFAEFVIDHSSVPARFTLRLVTFWPSKIAASCPHSAANGTTMTTGYGWDLSGNLSAGESTIAGSSVVDGATLTWNLKH